MAGYTLPLRELLMSSSVYEKFMKYLKRITISLYSLDL